LTLDAESRITTFLERPSRKEPALNNWVNSGVQVLNRQILDLIPPEGLVDLPKDVYSKHFHDHMFFGYPLRGRRIAIDSPERLKKAREEIELIFP
jgi:NDP-sugar pyrophosphorylase family protein